MQNIQGFLQKSRICNIFIIYEIIVPYFVFFVYLLIYGTNEDLSAKHRPNWDQMVKLDYCQPNTIQIEIRWLNWIIVSQTPSKLGSDG